MGEDKKVTDLSKRRADSGKDPVIEIADALTKVIAEVAPRCSPEEQLLGIELAARATVEALRATLGEDELNTVIVEVNRRSRQYTVLWDRANKGKIPLVESTHMFRQRAVIVPLRRDEQEEPGGEEGPSGTSNGEH